MGRTLQARKVPSVPSQPTTASQSHITAKCSVKIGATPAIELGGTRATSGYSQVQLRGALSLNGSNLRVLELANFSLAVGRTFVILDNTAHP